MEPGPLRERLAVEPWPLERARERAIPERPSGALNSVEDFHASGCTVYAQALAVA